MSNLFTPSQEAEIDRRASVIAARLIAKALAGSHDRIAAAVRGAPVLVPIFHLDEIARLAAGSSAGKADNISADKLLRSVVREEVAIALDVMADDAVNLP